MLPWILLEHQLAVSARDFPSSQAQVDQRCFQISMADRLGSPNHLSRCAHIIAYLQGRKKVFTALRVLLFAARALHLSQTETKGTGATAKAFSKQRRVIALNVWDMLLKSKVASEK